MPINTWNPVYFDVPTTATPGNFTTINPWPMSAPAPVRQYTPLVRQWDDAGNTAHGYWYRGSDGWKHLRATLMSNQIQKNINQGNYFGSYRPRYPAMAGLGKVLSEYIAQFRKHPDQESLAGIESTLGCMDGYLPPSRFHHFREGVVSQLTNYAPELFSCACCSQLSLGDRYPAHDAIGQYFCSACVDSYRVVQLDLEGGDWQMPGSVVTFREYEDYAEDRDDYTDHYVSHQFVASRHLRWVQSSGVYVTRHVMQLMVSSGPIEETLFDYHSGPDVGHIPSAYDKRQPCVLMGMELEVEVEGCDDSGDEEVRDCAIACVRKANAVNGRYMKAEHDGSLDAGFEMITGWTGLDVHEKVLRELVKVPEWRYLRSHNTSTCGLHVHIDRRGMTPLHVVKLQAFINDERNKGLIKCVARRYGTDYAKVHGHKNWLKELPAVFMQNVRDRTLWNGVSKMRAIREQYDCGAGVGEHQHDRYSALNWSNFNTVEFRLFRGSTKLTTIMACLEFAFAAWHFTRVTPHRLLNETEFIKFICAAENRKDTRYLRSYLHDRRYVAFYEYEQTMRPKDKRFREPPSVVEQTAASRNNTDSDALLTELGEAYRELAARPSADSN